MKGWADMDRKLRWEKWRCPGCGRKPSLPYDQVLGFRVRCACGYEGPHPLLPSANA